MVEITTEKIDYLVVGSGIAGLYTAIKLSTLGKVMVITKEKIKDSNTQYAQGGIAAVLDKGDSWQFHMQDTIIAGDGLCNKPAVEVLVTEGPKRVLELIYLGTSFDHVEGELDLTREAAHSRRRILHARGDATGVEIREALTRVLIRNPNIKVYEETFLIDLIVEDNRVKGALIRDNNKQYKKIISSAIILASGGCGYIYNNTSNPDVTTGDGIAVAYRAGADITDMEFIQFHPTTFYNPDGDSFLISESVRGEGGVLLNSEGNRFMFNYHHQGELAPRDIVARSIIAEAGKKGETHVWLDVTHFDDKYLADRFPTIYNNLQRHGLNMSKDLIPIIPAAHYLMGGVKTDTWGRTSLKHLYACGEVACSGVHGANRLASNSLLEGLVFGHRIYEVLKKDNSPHKDYEQLESIYTKPVGISNLPITELKFEFKQLMSNLVGIIRVPSELKQLIKFIDNTLTKIAKVNYVDQYYWELNNMLITGRLIARAALLREESRGGHYRLDYPDKSETWSRQKIIFNSKYPEGKIDVLE